MISAGMLTAGMISTFRPDLSLERSINNFTLPIPLTVYAEPSLKQYHDHVIPHFKNIKFNTETLGVFPNWYNAAENEVEKGNEYIMILEDDAIFCASAYKHLVDLLDTLAQEDFGYISLYTSAAVVPEHIRHFYKGWYQYTKADLWGAVCLVFKRENLIKYLNWSSKFVSPEVPTNVPPDKLASTFFRGYKNYMHVPSLCDHLLPLSTSVEGKPHVFGCPPEQMRNRLAGIFDKDF